MMKLLLPAHGHRSGRYARDVGGHRQGSRHDRRAVRLRDRS